MADVASKEQTTALFLSTMVTRTRRHTQLTKKLTNLTGNLCCAREHSFQFFVQLFYTVRGPYQRIVMEGEIMSSSIHKILVSLVEYQGSHV